MVSSGVSSRWELDHPVRYFLIRIWRSLPYPSINTDNSQGVIDNLIVELTDANTKIISGQGQISTKADVIALRDAMLGFQ